jgi:uncharacterized membrane protein HdeD (DUF308 family)
MRHWTAYEVFTLISGIVLIIAAVVPGMAAKNRFWATVGGAVCIGYAFYVANQTSGTFYFPVQIFVIPPAAAIYAIYAAVKHYRQRAEADRESIPRRDTDN